MGYIYRNIDVSDMSYDETTQFIRQELVGVTEEFAQRGSKHLTKFEIYQVLDKFEKRARLDWCFLSRFAAAQYLGTKLDGKTNNGYLTVKQQQELIIWLAKDTDRMRTY